MNKFLLSCSLSFLAGCTGLGDRLPHIQHAQVDLKNGEPCLTYAITAGDRISSIQIGSKFDKTDSFRKNLIAAPFIPEMNKCLPTFDYHFTTGKQYVVYYSVDNLKSRREKIIEGRFSLP